MEIPFWWWNLNNYVAPHIESSSVCIMYFVERNRIQQGDYNFKSAFDWLAEKRLGGKQKAFECNEAKNKPYNWYIKVAYFARQIYRKIVMVI